MADPKSKKTIPGVNNQVLLVDLSARKSKVIPVSQQDQRKYLGGKGLALKLLADHIPHGIDPLSPENILIMASGPVAGTSAPAGGRFCVASKSPLTGIFASSFVGGSFGLSLKKSGYDAIMITGKADHPVTLIVRDNKVKFQDARKDWGQDTYEFQDTHKKTGDWVVCGPAGENMVLYAVLVSGRRIAGRCGMGAVMGSKNLKGIAAKGTGKVVPANPDKFKNAVEAAQKKVKQNWNTGKNLKELGTPQNVDIYGTTGIMPVRNFSRASYEKRTEVNGLTLKDKHFVKNHGCTQCPIRCGRMGRFKGHDLVSPEYETIAMMGPNLEVGDLEWIAQYNDKLNRLGMDTISCGSSIGFAMELTEKGFLDSPLRFGDPEGVDTILEDIAYRRGLGNDLADGVMRMSRKYGGSDFAIHVKGLELAAYDPRGCVGQGLGYATANAGGTHLSGSTHSIEAESYLDPLTTRGKAHFVIYMQDLTDAVNSCIFCIQTEYPFLEENPVYKYTPMPILRFMMRYLPAQAIANADFSDYCNILSGLLGYTITPKEFYQVGERIFNLERVMNCREGISAKDDTLPKRMLEETREDKRPPVKLSKMLPEYYRLRGWDSNGVPKPGLLKSLEIRL